jgi:hypothetical protein
MSESLETRILNNIPGLNDDEDVQTEQTTQQGQEANETTTDGTVDNTSSPTNTQTESVKIRKHDGLVEKPNAENPNTRDLVDPVSGRIVARGGIERRVFEEGQRYRRENDSLKQTIQQAQSRFQGMDQVNRTAMELNVSPESAVAAMRVMADFIKDPVKTLEYLVAEVKSKGYQIPFLEQGVTQGMDMQAIQRMIDNKLSPLTQRQQQEEQQLQRQYSQQEAVKRELDTFLNEVPEADANLDVLAEMITAQPSLTLHGAYVRMVEWAMRQGIDHNQPLKPQILALQQSTQQQPVNQQPNNQNQPPLPGPRRLNTSNQRNAGEGMHSENTDWSFIVQKAMRENGYNL